MTWTLHLFPLGLSVPSRVGGRVVDVEMLVAVGHDPGDVAKELEPHVLSLLVPAMTLLKVGTDCVHEDGPHDAKVVAGDAGQAMELAQAQQVLVALSR